MGAIWTPFETFMSFSYLPTPSTKEIKARIRRVQQALGSLGHSAAIVVSSNPVQVRNRNVSYPYRQHSDFYYLSGSHEPDLTIMISSNLKRPILISKARSKEQILWEGKGADAQKIADSINAELVVTPLTINELRGRLAGTEELFFQNDERSEGWSLAYSLLTNPSYTRGKLPKRFSHLDLLLAPLRSIKSKEEIAMMQSAAKVSVAALKQVLPLVKVGASEAAIARALEFNFSVRGGGIAFPSIVATGRNAATLHYHQLSSRLKAGELTLMDIGADYGLYASDITRCLPNSGLFLGVQAQIYDLVLAAQQAALAQVKPNALVSEIYDSAATVLAGGLKDLKVFGRAPTKEIIKKGLFKQYFPHSIGHQIGLDTHDVGAMRGDGNARIKAGMVITIEPGLYFPKKVGLAPACGVRIEDTVVVQEKGQRKTCEVLTAGFPKGRGEIEELIAQASE